MVNAVCLEFFYYYCGHFRRSFFALNCAVWIMQTPRILRSVSSDHHRILQTMNRLTVSILMHLSQENFLRLLKLLLWKTSWKNSSVRPAAAPVPRLRLLMLTERLRREKRMEWGMGSDIRRSWTYMCQNKSEQTDFYEVKLCQIFHIPQGLTMALDL